MQNKTRLELVDYEAENLARLQKMFSRKWEFIFMQVPYVMEITYENAPTICKAAGLLKCSFHVFALGWSPE